MPRDRLRVVAILDGPNVPAWVHRVLSDVATSENAELVGASFVPAPVRRRDGLGFRAFEALDRRLFAISNDPLAPRDASPLLERCAPLAAPAAARPDLLLKLTSAPFPADWLAVAPLGVWTFDHVEHEGRGGVAFFWELARDLPVNVTCLRARTAAGERVLVRAAAVADRTSLVRSRHAALWSSAGFVARALRDAADPAEAASEDAKAPAVSGPERPPTTLEVARFAASAGLRGARDRLRMRGSNETWFVALRRSQGSLVNGSMHGFEPVPMPGDRFYADPFLVPDESRLWLFVEDADRASGKGVIRCSEVRADGSIGESHVVLDCDYHLSYPFVFRSGDAWFMLPETSGHRTVELWRAVEFPWHWKLDRVLLDDVTAVDATLLEHDGRLWLFAGTRELGGARQYELSAFHADSLHGDWRPHSHNPIVSDVRHARPAGPFFREGGQLYRPGQDCSGAYGVGFWIHRVDRLDERVYEETPVRYVGRDWHPGLVGTHTIHRAGGFDAIDGRVWLRRGRAFPG